MYWIRKTRNNSLKLKVTRGILLLCFSLLLIDGFGQSPLYFRKNFGDSLPNIDQGDYVKALPNGYMIGGNTTNSYPNFDHYFIKTNLNGTLNWEVKESDLSTSKIIWGGTFKDNYFYYVGLTRDTITNLETGLMTKTDTLGNIIWSKTVGDSTKFNAFYEIIADLNGDFVLSGSILDTTAGATWGYLAKVDSAGNKIWSNEFPGMFVNGIEDLTQLPDSSFVLTGFHDQNVLVSLLWVLRTDPNGNSIWDTTLTFNYNSQSGKDIITTYDNGLVVVGYTGHNDIMTRGLIFKVDSNNQILWSKILAENPDGSGQIYYSVINTVFELPDHSIVCSGSLSINGNPKKRMLLMKFDESGNELWRRTFTPSGANHTYGFSMDTVSDGGFVIVGRTDYLNNPNVYLVKTNCLGFTYPPTADFSTTNNNNSFTFYNYSNFADTCIYYFGDGDSAIVLLTDTIPVTHSYIGTGPFYPYLLAFACGEIDTIYQTIYTGVNDSYGIINRTFSIFPNPAKDNLTISYIIPEDIKDLNFIISDFCGRIILIQKLQAIQRDQDIDISFLSPGSYQVSVEHEGVVLSTRKMVVIR